MSNWDRWLDENYEENAPKVQKIKRHQRYADENKPQKKKENPKHQSES
jgi:hypothetical protein